MYSKSQLQVSCTTFFFLVCSVKAQKRTDVCNHCKSQTEQIHHVNSNLKPLLITHGQTIVGECFDDIDCAKLVGTDRFMNENFSTY